jgi:hypothetical protein
MNENHHILGPLHLHGNPHQVKVGMIYIFVTIILYDHVIHDDTSIHNILKAFLVPKSSRYSHNSKPGLQKSQMLSPHLS